MATISFSAPSAASAVISEPIPTPEQGKEIAVSQPSTLAVNTPPPTNGIEGEITANDIKPPRINLVQKTGKLGDLFTPGHFVYDKSFALSDGKQPLKVTILRFRKYYQEKLEFDESEQQSPKKFDTAAEVRANGGQLVDWKGASYYQEAADLLLAIQAPESLDEDNLAFFPYSQGGVNYGLAAYTITSSSFTSLGKRIITDATLLLRDGLFTGQYNLISEKKTSPKNSWFVPVATFDKKHSPEAAQFFRNIAGL